MNNFKVGDFVCFSLSNKDDIKLFTNSGVIIHISNDVASILNGQHTNIIYNISEDRIRPLSDKEDIINEINDYYDKEIKRYKSKIKSVKREHYEEEIVLKYLQLKQEILSTARNMINSEEDYGFETRLKAICQKKKELFEIKCEGLNDARKFNGEVKYNMTVLDKQRNNTIKSLDSSVEELKRKFRL